jgi:hypothetical protein
MTAQQKGGALRLAQVVPFSVTWFESHGDRVVDIAKCGPRRSFSIYRTD